MWRVKVEKKKKIKGRNYHSDKRKGKERWKTFSPQGPWRSMRQYGQGKWNGRSGWECRYSASDKTDCDMILDMGRNIINFFMGMQEKANSLSQSAQDMVVILSVVMYVSNRSWFYFSLSDCCFLMPFNLGFLKLSNVRCSLIWVISVNSKMVGSNETKILNSSYDLYFSSHNTSIRMVTCILFQWG